MSKGAKKYVFKTKDGTKLMIISSNQNDAVQKFASLVKSVADWPHLRILKV